MRPRAASNPSRTIPQKDTWQSLNLAEKIPETILKHNPGLVQRTINTMAKNLMVEWRSTIDNGWLNITVKGDDAEALRSLLTREFGEAPVQFSKIEKWDVWKGFITGAGRVGYGVYVDIGVREPRPKDALYPLHRMRAQLSDGNQEPVKQILTMNSLVDYLPVKTLVTDIEEGKITVQLADETMERLSSWRKYPFDRIILVGLTKAEAVSARDHTGLSAEIIGVEQLSLFVQAYVLKIGTQAPGIIARIGSRLRGISLGAYRSWKMLD